MAWAFYYLEQEVLLCQSQGRVLAVQGTPVRVAALLVLLPLSCRRSAEAEETPPHVVYFPQTGHHLAEPFLTFWRSHGEIRIFGYPISETLEREGLLVHYFERTCMEAPLGCNNADCPVQLTRVGALLTADRTDLAF